MFYRRLSFILSFNLVFLLALAMILINVVSIGSTQSLLLKNKVLEGKLLMHAIEQSLHRLPSAPLGTKREDIETLLKRSDYEYVLVLDPDLGERFSLGSTAVQKEALVQATRQALTTGHMETQLSGSTWGVFWTQKSNLILSAPLYHGRTLVAGISMVFHLQRIYRQLRHMQLFVSFYILINLILLTFVGRYRFSKSTITPLKKLVETAEAYKMDSETLFLGTEKEGNEFNHLSNALNQMLQRISKDQENLRLTVHSLKQANLDLKHAQNDIINAEKLASVGRLSAGIAHEIGNPIAIAMGYLELLKRNDISPSEREDFTVRTENEIHRINDIIRQLLNFSRPSSSVLTKISIHETLLDIVTIFKYQPLMKNI